MIEWIIGDVPHCASGEPVYAAAMKKVVWFVLTMTVVPMLACTSRADDAEDTETTHDELTAVQLDAVKAQLRSICDAHTGETDTYALVRTQVDPLIAKLVTHFGPRSATSKLPLVAGAWHQIWTDYPFASAPFISMDPQQVYQVVSADGHYWNIGDERAAGFIGLTGVLRGSFVPTGTKIALEFTNVGFRFGRIARGEELVALADGLESGSRHYVGLPGGGRAPKGPVGIKGTLETLYVDADLRVERGSQTTFVAPDGTVVPGYEDKIFVLDRVTTVAK